MTPFQAYYGRKPTVSHFRVFGCSAFVHIPKEKRQKLDFKSRKLLFLGYSAESDAYRLYDPDTRTTTVSRDVVFDESVITFAEGAAAQPIPILPPPSLPDPPASPVITPSTSHPVPPIQPPDVSPDHALADSDSDLDVADATPEVDLAPPRREKRIPGWLYSTVAFSGVTELPVPPPAGLPRQQSEYPLYTKGEVVHGYGRGSKKLGFPTANLSIDSLPSEVARLPKGVYFGCAQVIGEGFDSDVHRMVMNIGNRPTFEKDDTLSLEVHILHDFGTDFYGKELRIAILGFIREEMQFQSLDDLSTRIKKDVQVMHEHLPNADFELQKQVPFFTL
ncbi:hypothetical protein L7F22_018724 [Adiantum nelumboides]|nr:hypothetical protein [Adiantum nelumboides]